MGKSLHTRIQHKYDSKANWDKATFAPLAGELIIYSDGEDGDSSSPALKIGDGTTPVGDLPYLTTGGEGDTSNSLTGVSVAGKAVNVSNGVAAIPTATTSVYGATKLSTAVDSDATDVAATPSAVKKAYDLAKGGGDYGRHCWLKETYDIIDNSEIKETQLSNTVTIYEVASGVTSVVKYSSEMSDGVLVNPQKVTLTPSSYWDSSTGTYIYYPLVSTSTDSSINTGASLGELTSRLTTLCSTSIMYIQIDDSNEIYRVYNNIGVAANMSYLGAFSADYVNINDTSYPCNLKVLGGSDKIQGSSAMHEAYLIEVDNSTTINRSAPELLYTDAADSFVEGDNGDGTIYMYLGVPSEDVPPNRFNQHCWRRQSKSVVSEETSPTDYFTYVSTSVTQGTVPSSISVANSVSIEDGKWVPSGDIKYYQVTQNYTDYGQEFHGKEVCLYYYDLKVPGASSVSYTFGLRSSITTEFDFYVSSRLNSNEVVYMAFNPTSDSDWTGATVYKLTTTESNFWPWIVHRLYDGGGPNNGQFYYGHTFVAISNAYVLIENTSNNDSTSEPSAPIQTIDELIYTNSPTSFKIGENNDGLIYSYIGIPAELWTSRRSSSSSGSTATNNAAKIATGSYPGSGTYGSSNANSLTFDFKPKLVFINYTSDSISSSYDKHYSVVFNTEILSRNYMNNAAIVHSTQEGQSTLSSGALTAKLSRNTLSWYHLSTAESQLNMSGCTYHYVAIG